MGLLIFFFTSKLIGTIFIIFFFTSKLIRRDDWDYFFSQVSFNRRDDWDYFIYFFSQVCLMSQSWDNVTEHY